ncbi:MAG TPA: hypothetical protein P5266_07935 [Candidatus Fermentibacter sp.]|nr:hypothetical protein [Candidatus Fermentibacter sp.]
MSSCSRSAEAVEYLLGLLDPPMAASFLEHCAGCPECTEALEAEKLIEQGLAGSYGIPGGLLDRIDASIDLLDKPSGRFTIQRAVAASGAAAAVLFGAWRLLASSGRSLLAGDGFHQVAQAAARAMEPGSVWIAAIAFGIVLTTVTMVFLASRYGR